MVVQVLKYDPYPVNAGDWFNLWIKLQNIGQADAKNVKFELIPDYPFESNDSLIRSYGLIFGTINSYKAYQTYDSSQVILKYRVRAADNAPDGANNIKFKISFDNSEGSIFNLPIEIGKTKTDFDVIMQDSTTSGTSFSIVNIGENDASAVKIYIDPQNNLRLTGTSASILGNLAKGDFTTATFQIAPGLDLKEIKIKIDYTDIAGIRNSLEKTVPVNLDQTFANITATGFKNKTTSSSSNLFSNAIPVVIGLILGMIILRIYQRVKKKKKE
jgi:hypothetical protein